MKVKSYMWSLGFSIHDKDKSYYCPMTKAELYQLDDEFFCSVDYRKCALSDMIAPYVRGKVVGLEDVRCVYNKDGVIVYEVKYVVRKNGVLEQCQCEVLIQELT